MNTKDFLNILQDLHQLASISYEQLDKLLLQFPYCHNLRLLLLKKYQTDEHISFERQLSLASTYAPDRQFLSQFVQSTPPVNNVIHLRKEEKESVVEPTEEVNPTTEESLIKTKQIPENNKTEEAIITEEDTKANESDDLDDNEPIVEKEPPQPPKTEDKKQSTTPVAHKVSQTPPRLDLMEILALKKESNKPDTEERNMSYMPLEEWVQSFTPPRINDKTESQSKRKRFKLSRIPVFEDSDMLELFGHHPKPQEQEEKEIIASPEEQTELDSIAELLEKAQETAQQEELIEERPVDPTPIEEPPKKPFDFFTDSTEAFLKSLSNKKQKKTKSTANNLDNIAKESVTENEEVISETLANLLALQGKKDKAIKMYKALSLKFPEKKLFFAEQIEELSREL